MPLLGKRALLGKVIDGAEDGGWSAIHLNPGPTGGVRNPILLELSDGQRRLLVRVYIWNCTGGGRDLPGEWRIQFTSINQFDDRGVDRVAVLGWWEEGQVLVGWDYEKHPDPGESSSAQVSEEALQKVRAQRVATHLRGNEELVVAFDPSFLPHYLLHFQDLHGFDDSPEEVAALEKVAETEGVVDDREFEAFGPERQRKLKVISEVLRDSSFADRVARVYNNKCAFCGVQLKLIEAAHILPVASSGSDDTANGLALCPLHHRAFDRSLVTLTETYEIIVNHEKLEELQHQGLGGGKEGFLDGLLNHVSVPRATSDRPDPRLIREGNKVREWSE